MTKKVIALFLLISLLLTFTACSINKPPEDTNNPEKAKDNNELPIQEQDKVATIEEIQLGDFKEKVVEKLGENYSEIHFEEAGHFPEPFYNWEFKKGFIISIGKESNQVLQIMATAPTAKTNLGVQIGDKAEEALQIYRENYIEPESIHGGKLYGVFKVENGQAMILDFNTEDEIVNPPEEIKPDAKVERLLLTYPEFLDDSF
ncbi:MAG: hypothetical protein ACOYJ1_15195 [Peptococcales bacterium]|jgi:hypothetical protein